MIENQHQKKTKKKNKQKIKITKLLVLLLHYCLLLVPPKANDLIRVYVFYNFVIINMIIFHSNYQ